MNDEQMKEADLRWYAKKTPEEMGESAWRLAMNLRGQQHQDLMDKAADCMALYDPETMSSEEAGLSLGVTQAFREPELPAFNVVQAAGDTLISQLIRNKVRPLFVTDGGDGELQAKAEGMTRVVETGFMESGIWGDLGRRWARDATVFGTGWVKCTPDYRSSRVLIERSLNWEVYSAHIDARSGKPRQRCHIYPVDREEMLSRYGDDKKVRKAIEDAPPVSAQDGAGQFDRGYIVDQILVTEIWHLPSKRVDLDDKEAWELGTTKDHHDGRHCIVIGGAADGVATLLAEAWPFDYFPLHEFKLIGKNMGVRGRGVPETLLGVQLALNRTCKRLDKILHLHGRPIIGIDRRAKINKDMLTNDVALVIEMNGQGGLSYITPNSVSPEFINQIERLVRWGFEQIGLSQMSATSRKPEGLESGVALRTVLDTESMRHSDPFLGWEDAHIRLARGYVDCVRLLSEHAKEHGGDFTAYWGDEKETREINWGDVDMPETKFRLRAWPTNLFSQTPGAKKDEILTFYRDGLFDKEESLEHLDYPDLRSARDAVLAARDNIDKILRRMVEQKKPHVPHPYMNLEMARKMGITVLNRLEANDRVDSPECDLVRQWLENVDFIIADIQRKAMEQQAAAQAAAQGMGPGGPPPGPPGPAAAAPPEAPPKEANPMENAA
jgi:hypothetical protein